VTAAGALLLALLIALVFSLQDAQFVHHGRVAFHFRYRGLYREPPDPGGYARVARHRGARLVESFAVEPLTLPDVPGGVSGVLPLAAAAYLRGLAQRDQSFVLQSEGKAKVNETPAYAINYSTRVEGRKMDGRDVLLVPARTGARQGVVLVMLTPASPLYTDTSPVGNSGALHQPQHTFAFGA
jgi:hypothetical protein